MDTFSGYKLPRGRHGLEPEVVAANQRWRLIGAGVEIFAEHGYIGTTSRLIAGRAAVSSSTFYAHFDSVPALLQVCFEVAAESVTDLVSRPCRSRSDRHHDIEASIQAALAFAASEPELVLMLGPQPAVAVAGIALERQRLIKRLAELLRGARRSPADRAVPAGVEEHLAAAAVSVAIERVLIGDADRLSKLGPELAQLLVGT